LIQSLAEITTAYSGGLLPPGALRGSLASGGFTRSPARSLSGLSVGGRVWPVSVGRSVAGRAWPGGGGLGGANRLFSELVVGIGGLQAPLAGGAGLVGAISARFGPVALVFGGVVQRGQQRLDLVGWDDDGGLAGGCGAVGWDDGTTT
jgi:hypothetical protein